MNKKEQQEYLEQYEKAKKKGVSFFPETLVKDAVVALIVFLILVALVLITGSTLEEPANPADTSYTPRPEWYFLFLYQTLKYFPGSLEVIAIVVLPAVGLGVIFLLPFLDKSKYRHFLNRPWVTIGTVVVILFIVTMTILAFVEAPPPAVSADIGDIAMLYTENCSGCHGASITVQDNTNLHEIIAKGSHEGMPAWSGDLSTDQIDGLVGMITQPDGYMLFNQYCSECHGVDELVAIDPFILQAALGKDVGFESHTGAEMPNFAEIFTNEERVELINFLIAPDGQRLFAINCSACHGGFVATEMDEPELRDVIVNGGMHLDMPAMKSALTDVELSTLAAYVVDAAGTPAGKPLFENYCAQCHGVRVPTANSVEEAKTIIETGGSHQEMPIWGDVLTQAQIDALVAYTLEVSQGTPYQVGQRLYAENCVSCHGLFGEGGLNPAVPGDLIMPISSAEYLRTRTDDTLRQIITQGQSAAGMPPYGDLLDDDEVDALIAYLRFWQENPPVGDELPVYDTGGSTTDTSGTTAEEPAVVEEPAETTAPTAAALFSENCAACHGKDAEGASAPTLRSVDFKDANDVESIKEILLNGISGTGMPAWRGKFSDEQIQDMAVYILELPELGQVDESVDVVDEGPGTGEVSFTGDVLPIFDEHCKMCHGTAGGWDGTTYATVIESGNNGPSVIPGDSANSLLAKKMLGEQESGAIMPPSGKLGDDVLQIILDWIDAGALDN